MVLFLKQGHSQRYCLLRIKFICILALKAVFYSGCFPIKLQNNTGSILPRYIQFLTSSEHFDLEPTRVLGIIKLTLKKRLLFSLDHRYSSLNTISFIIKSQANKDLKDQNNAQLQQLHDPQIPQLKAFQVQQLGKEGLDYLRHYYFSRTDKIMLLDMLQTEFEEKTSKKSTISKYERYKTEPKMGVQKNNQHHQPRKDHRSQSFIFNLKVKNAQNTPIIHKKSKTLMKKYVFAQSKTQFKDHKGSTPYQQRKLNQKKAHQQKQYRSKQQTSNEIKLEILRGRLMKHSDMLNSQKKSDQNLDKSNIRETQASAKEKDENLLTLTQQSQVNLVSPKISNTLSLAEQKRKTSQKEKVQFKNIKVTFKQLIRAQKCPAFQKNIKKCVESDLLKSINVTSNQNDNQQTLQHSESKQKQFFNQQLKNPKSVTSKSKIKSHIRHSKSSSGYMQKFISSVMTIKPSNFQQKSSHSSNKQINSRLQYKNSLINVSKVSLNSKSVQQRRKQMSKRQKTQMFKTQPKQFSGWEYPNDFSQRQIFF